MSTNVERLLRAWLCLLALLSATTIPLSPPAHPADAPAAVSPVFGVNTHFASRLHDPRRIPAQTATVAVTGFRWIREDFHWYRIQRTADAYDWSYTDTMVASATAQRLTVVGVLGHPPGWATRTPSDDPYDNSFAAPDPDRFAQWAATTVARYHGAVHYWQIWNEPDNPQFWLPAPDPVAYAALVHATVTAIAAVAPDVQIVSAGVNPFDTGFLRAAAAHGLWNDVDIIAIHPYVNPQAPDDAHLDTASQALAPLMHRYGPKPIWATEIGWGSSTSDRDPPAA